MRPAGLVYFHAFIGPSVKTDFLQSLYCTAPSAMSIPSRWMKTATPASSHVQATHQCKRQTKVFSMLPTGLKVSPPSIVPASWQIISTMAFSIQRDCTST